MTKKCCSCKEIKPRGEFHKSRSSKDGLHTSCKVCSSMRSKAYREQGQRLRPIEPYTNQTRPSQYEGAIEVKLYGNNDLWTILDFEVFEKYSHLKFYLIGRYAGIRPGADSVRLHKLIVSFPIVDHINRDPLDNRRANLRSATSSQNQWNKSMSRNNASGYRGVSWDKRKQKWVAQIAVNGHRRFLGYFADAIDAAKAYDKAASARGEHAVLNLEWSDNSAP